MQRSTLATILARLPLILRNRYAGNADRFWVNKYNDLLTELEALQTGPQNLVMVPVPWQVISSNEVVLPHGLSDISNLYRSTGGDVSFEPAGRGAHILEDVPAASLVISVNEVAGSRDQFGRRMIKIFNTDPATQVGDGILIHGPQSGYLPGEYKPTDKPKASWVISQMPVNLGEVDVSMPMEEGEYDWPIVTAADSPVSPDFYYTIRDFLIAKGHRAYHRIAASSDQTSLPPDWDTMVEAYLRFKGEVQTDQSSKDSQDWGAIWTTEKRRWTGFHSKIAAASQTPARRPGFSFSTRR